MKNWTVEDEKLFEQLWHEFPARNGKKSDKLGARKEYQKIPPQLRRDLDEKIRVAIGKQKRSWEWLKEDGAYIPDLRKWLKHQMWEDEVREEPICESGYWQPFREKFRVRSTEGCNHAIREHREKVGRGYLVLQCQACDCEKRILP